MCSLCAIWYVCTIYYIWYIYSVVCVSFCQFHWEAPREFAIAFCWFDCWNVNNFLVFRVTTNRLTDTHTHTKVNIHTRTHAQRSARTHSSAKHSVAVRTSIELLFKLNFFVLFFYSLKWTRRSFFGIYAGTPLNPPPPLSLSLSFVVFQLVTVFFSVTASVLFRGDAGNKINMIPAIDWWTNKHREE